MKTRWPSVKISGLRIKLGTYLEYLAFVGGNEFGHLTEAWRK
jgi:hypothetical protein